MVVVITNIGAFVIINSFRTSKRSVVLVSQPIEELNQEIVYERRYAMSWLVGWRSDWDEVPTDM